MRKLAIVLGAFGFMSFAGVVHADQKTENTEKTDTSTTLGGKHKTTHTKKIERADGSQTETKTETTRPKNAADDRDNDRDNDHNRATPARDDGNGASTKTEEHTTLTGKKQMKTTKKVNHADGSQTETTTTTTEPKRNK